MALGVKLDGDLSLLVAQPIIDRGYDVATVVEEGLGGAKEPGPMDPCSG